MVVNVKSISEVTLVVNIHVGVPWSTLPGAVFMYVEVLDRISVERSIELKSLIYLSFQNSNGWLLYCQVGHFDIKSVEMNPLEALTDIVG